MPSTVIRRFSYDDASRTLFVTFIDGDVYAYFDVPPAVERGFRAAMSKGGYFSRAIRDRYRFRKLPRDGGPPEPLGVPAG